MTIEKEPSAALEIQNLSVTYAGAEQPAVNGVSFDVPDNKITSIIGPSGCGKSTLLRTLNRMIDGDIERELKWWEKLAMTKPDALFQGSVQFGGEDILAFHPRQQMSEITELRARIGMVFQKPNPFPMSIFENVAYGLKLKRLNKRLIAEKVEAALHQADLWEEVKDRLSESALSLSGGQQQRLVIARALAVEPEVLLLDEPTSALDPVATLKIEELLQEIKARCTVLIVTHNMEQAARLADWTAFMYCGELIEHNQTAKLFSQPQKILTANYVSGRFG